MADEIIIETTSAEVISVGTPGPQGPQGAAGTGLETLTTQGDTLYRGASTGERLPIGTTGQILRVSASGIPEWGAAPASGVSSVNGETGAVTVAAALHAAEHEAGEADEIQAMAALVATDVLDLNGVYFHDGTLTSGRPNFFRTGTRKNTKLVYNSGTGQWNLVRNLTIEAVGVDGPDTVPWGNDWENFVTPTSVTVTRLGLEDMTQKLAETGSAATATTSQDGLISAADLTKLNGIAAGAEVNVNADWNASNGDAQILNKPTSLTPTAHAASHAAAGSDPLAPSDIQAQSIFSVESLVITTTTQVTLTAARAKIYDLVQYAGAQVDVKLPSTNALQGDIIVLRWGTGGDSIRIIQSASGSPITTVSSGEQKRFIRGATDTWSLVPVDTHTHPATAISDSTTAGRALLTGADAAAQRTSLGLGTAATSATGDFAAASHAHGNINSSGQVGSDSGRVLVTTTAGAVTTLALGTAGQVLTVNSGANGVEFAAAAGGVADGDKGDITVSNSGATWTIDANAVTNADLAQVATATLKGRSTAGTGNVEDLSASDARTVLGLATTSAVTFASLATSPAANTAALTTTGYSITGSNAQSLVDLSGTWNTSGTPSAIRLNVTDTASNASSLLMQLQTGGTNRLTVSKGGAVVCASSLTATALAISNGDLVNNGFPVLRSSGTEMLAFTTNSNVNLSANGAYSIGWASGGPTVSNADVRMWRDAAATWALRDGTNAMEARVYGTFTSSTSYQRMTIKSVKQTLSALSGASASTTGTFIPDGAVVVGVTTRVATALTGAAGYTIGDGTDADRWGDITGTAVGTTSDNANWTAGTIECFTAGGEITLTAKTSNFTAGAIEICVFYLAGQAD